MKGISSSRIDSRSTDVAGTSAPAATLEGELLVLLSKMSLAVPALSAAVLALVAGLATRDVALHWAALWWCVTAPLLFVGPLTLARMNLVDAARNAGQLRVVWWLSALNAAVHGSTLVFFPFVGGDLRYVLSIIIIALCAGAMTACAGYLPIFALYLVGMLGPLALLWAWDPGNAVGGWLAPLQAGLVVFYGAFLVGSARNMFAMFRQEFESRQAQTALNRELTGTLEQAEAASRAKTRFLAAASHDLRQPMHTASLYSASLSMQPLDERARAIAERLGQSLDILSSQMDALLDVSKLDAGVMKSDIGPVALSPLLARLDHAYRPACEEKGVSLHMASGDDLVVRTDPMLLERILGNLLSNAVRYTDAGEVVVVCAAYGHAVTIRVQDTGCGIPEEERNRVFEEFYQLGNPERDRARGLGLGLAIVRRLAEMLSIDVALESAPGEGACFMLTVAAASPAPAQPKAPAEADAASSLVGAELLVIDDESDVRESMGLLLESMALTAHGAAGTQEAVAHVRERPVAAVLADLRLRGNDDGIAAIRAVRAVQPDVPALLISGDTAPDRLRDAHDAGLELLHKPVPADDLRAAITGLLSGRT